MKGCSQPWRVPLLLVLLIGVCIALPQCVVGNQTGQPCEVSADCSGRTPRCFQGRCTYCSQDADCPTGQVCTRTGVIASCQTKTTSEPDPRTEPPTPREDNTTPPEPPSSDKTAGEPGREPSQEHPSEGVVEKHKDQTDGGSPEPTQPDTQEAPVDEPTPEEPGETKDETPDPGGCQMGQGRACYTGPMGTHGVGVCKSGAQLCVNGIWGSCQGEITPTSERCDGQDNDCDGTIDEGNPGSGKSCDSGKKGICAAGTTRCSQGAIDCVANQSPKTETCNGKDDDCDGSTDEGNPGGGKSCSSGKPGECAAGTTRCSRGMITCVANQSPKAETCNGKDDDCDGSIDEGNPGGGGVCTTTQPGECRAGTRRCSNGRLVCNATNQPTPEVCDGKDNDCDGRIDDNIAPKTCYTIDGSYCRRGTSACVNGATTCQNTQTFNCSSTTQCGVCPGGTAMNRCQVRLRRCIHL